MESSSSTLALQSRDRSPWWRERTWPLLYTAFVIGLVAVMLWLNALDVRQGWVRTFYGAIGCWLVSLFIIRSFRIWRFRRLASSETGSGSMGERILGIAEVCVFALLWLLFLEAIARALPPLSNSSYNYPGHQFVWPERYAARNSLGLNDTEPQRQKAGQRVLVLGDSYVEGAGVRRAERFCERLQRLLSETDPEAEVIAGGISGWDTGHEASFLERHGPRLEPDIVVVAYVLNDADWDDRLVERPSPLELWLQTRLRSYLCYRLFRMRRAGFARYWEQVRRQHQPDSASWRGVERELQRIVDWCRREKVSCYLAVMPVFTTDADAVRDVMESVVTQASRLGFTAYSTLDDFDGRWIEFAVSRSDAHPNAAGHERIARRLYRELQNRP